MSTPLPYTPYSTFLRRYFAEKVQKIPLQLGTTCPVRDGTLGKRGCAFCNGVSFVPAYYDRNDSIQMQLEKGKAFFSRKACGMNSVAYLAYFQSGTSTYGDFTLFQKSCLEALSVPAVRGIVVSTRPDCLLAEHLSFLAELALRCFVLVEIGVETFDDQVLASIGRGHSSAVSEEALLRLAERNIPSCVHLILSLPGEKCDSVISSARRLAGLPVDVVKLHQLQIVKGSTFARMYHAAPAAFHLYSCDRYVQDVATFLEYLPSNIALERFVSESPSSALLAPRWNVKPDVVQHRVVKELHQRGTFQGCRV